MICSTPLWGAESPPVCRAAFISPEEIEDGGGLVKESGEAQLFSGGHRPDRGSPFRRKEQGRQGRVGCRCGYGEQRRDELLPAAVDVVLETGQASVSMLQRRLKLGYSRAARLVDQMEDRGALWGPLRAPSHGSCSSPAPSGTRCRWAAIPLPPLTNHPLKRTENKTNGGRFLPPFNASKWVFHEAETLENVLKT